MRFMIASTVDPKKTTLEQPMTDALFDAYMKFNEDLATAGVLVASEGLNPAGVRAQVVVKNGVRVATDGPFTETKELVGGFYIIDVKSKDEALKWALRCPVGMASADVLELHQLTGAEDLPPELIARVEKMAPTWSKSFKAGR